ncbi:BEN domain-containing protein 5 isoform X2 [Ixodes scapularis]|uniref:BEN domain-containing protein 5 isoform X2 n=1 Tax=Ixodes scapularis TaxID=6945 RepID=UPI001C3873AB|nr:BEN domain-containing protein 5 isoform X2 [Ixodes scapularis]
MTDSKEEMDEYLEKRRGAAPTKQRKTSKQEAAPKSKKRKRQDAKQMAELELLGTLSSSGDEDSPSMKKLKLENEHLRHLNYKLQEALCAKVLAKGFYGSEEDQVLVGGHDHRIVMAPEVVRPAAQLPAPALQPARGLPASQPHALPPSVRRVVEMHCGENVWLHKDTFETLLGAERDALFVKKAAVAIWSSEVLIRRSVTGTLSNRSIAANPNMSPQAPMTPQKVKAIRSFFEHYARQTTAHEGVIAGRAKNIRRYLSEKVSELRRRERGGGVEETLD